MSTVVRSRRRRRRVSSSASEVVSFSEQQPSTSKLSRKRRNGRIKMTKIEQYEQLLKGLSDKIEEFQGKEMTLDEMDQPNSSYIATSKLQQKFMAVFQRAQKSQTGSSKVRLGRRCEKLVKFEEMEPEFNEEITAMLTRKKPQLCPDFSDVRKAIATVNEKFNKGLSDDVVTKKAETCFKNIVMKFRKHRIHDFREDFGSVYTDLKDNDPALQDISLHEQLKQQAVEGERKMEQVFEQFSTLQDTRGEVAEEVISGDSDSEGADGDEEEDDVGGVEDEEKITDEQLFSSDEVAKSDNITTNSSNNTVFDEKPSNLYILREQSNGNNASDDSDCMIIGDLP